MGTCKKCGCPIGQHDDTGCHGQQHLTPWDSEDCLCTLTLEEARES